MEEIWKSIEENFNYEVSSLDRIRSLARAIKGIDNKIYHRKGIILRRYKTIPGYLTVNIPIQKKTIVKTVHVLVAKAFIDNPNNYPCVLHKNDIKDDNRIENLYWGTHKMNAIDRVANNELYGDNHPGSKITIVQANEIRELIKEGKLSFSNIGFKYGVNKTTISQIKRGVTRKYDNL